MTDTLRQGGEKAKPKLDERFITAIQGKEFVIYAGLLDLAHQMRLKKLQVEPLQYPTGQNGFNAICKAVAESENGDVFSDVGDANPTNTNKKVVNHILRMASTRAKARTLRDMTNIGITCLEELGDLEIEENGADSGTFPGDVGSREPGNPHNSRNGKTDTNQRQGNGGGKDAHAGNERETGSTRSAYGTAHNGESPSGTDKVQEAQIKAIQMIAKKRKIEGAALDEIVKQQYGIPLANLSSVQAGELIRGLQTQNTIQ